MKTKLLKLVRKEAKDVIFDLDNGNTLYGYKFSSKIRANVEFKDEDIEKGIHERRLLRRAHCIHRVKTLRADRMFRRLWVLLEQKRKEQAMSRIEMVIDKCIFCRSCLKYEHKKVCYDPAFICDRTKRLIAIAINNTMLSDIPIPSWCPLEIYDDTSFVK